MGCCAEAHLVLRLFTRRSRHVAHLRHFLPWSRMVEARLHGRLLIHRVDLVLADPGHVRALVPCGLLVGHWSPARVLPELQLQGHLRGENDEPNILSDVISFTVPHSYTLCCNLTSHERRRRAYYEAKPSNTEAMFPPRTPSPHTP